jgi:hypothetical protein
MVRPNYLATHYLPHPDFDRLQLPKLRTFRLSIHIHPWERLYGNSGDFEEQPVHFYGNSIVRFGLHLTLDLLLRPPGFEFPDHRLTVSGVVELEAYWTSRTMSKTRLEYGRTDPASISG